MSNIIKIKELNKRGFLREGAVVTLGGFEGKPIEWVVFEVGGDSCTLFSLKELCQMAYHKKRKEITWEDCTLRKWLNGKFFKKAITAEEKAGILLAKVSGNGVHSANNLPETSDFVFLLNTAEAERLTTDFLKTGNWWWLRNRGSLSSSPFLCVPPRRGVFSRVRCGQRQQRGASGFKT
ncbi:MAG: DUF6273 domain-containing protein [Firmicutes bacterium]|nr:DUF6273 domain-containing protein [Bacillota bacterium]